MKRLSTSDPLTADDVAARVDRAAMRAWRVLSEVRQLSPELHADVMRSRYLSCGVLEGLAGELEAWGVAPVPPDQAAPLSPSEPAPTTASAR